MTRVPVSVEGCGEDGPWLLPETRGSGALALAWMTGQAPALVGMGSAAQNKPLCLPGPSLPKEWSLDPLHPWTILGELVRTGIPGDHPRPRVRVLGARPAMLHFSELPGCASQPPPATPWSPYRGT